MTDLPAQSREAEQFVHVREVEHRQPAQAVGQLHRRQRLLPEGGALVRRHPVRGQRPRRRLVHMLVLGVAMGEHVLQVVGQRPHATFFHQQHGRRRNRLVLVVQELRHRVFHVAHAGPVHHVALADALLGRHVFDENHHPLAHVTRQQVVQVLDAPRADLRVAVGQRVLHRGDVRRRVDQAEQLERAAQPAALLFGQRAREQALGIKPAGHEQVVVQRQRAVGEAGLGMEVAGHRVLVDRDLGVGHANALERRHRLELQEAVRVVEGGQQGSHRGREREVRQGRGHMAAHPDVLLAVQHEVGQRRHHRLPETGQHLPRRRLQPAVPQQRHQRHHEQEVPRAKLARALDRRECDLDVRVVHQRHQQRAERRILDIAERAGRQQPPRRALLAGVAREGAEPVLGRLHVRLLRARCQRRRRDDGEGLVGAVQERAHHIRGGLSAKRGQRAHRGHPHRRVGIPQRPLDSRQPAVRGLGAGGFRHLQRARPDLGRLVRQQQRRDQVALVQGIEQVDGVEHAARFRVRQLAHQRFDRLRPEVGAADVGGHHVLLLDAAPERPQVLLARPHRREHPQPDHGQAGVAQLLPVPAQAPVLDQDEDQQRPHALRQPVHRHVDERLGAVLQFHRQRQEQYLARGLVHGVTQRGVEHAGQARRPQRAVEQHHHRGGAQAHRQHQQREADAEHAMDAAGQPHLDHEADQRQVNRDLREERRDGVGIGGALGFRRRHVELLLDDRGADGRKADHQRDHLQVPGRSKQLDGLAAADALVLAGLGGVARARRLLALQDEGDDEEAEAHDRGADQQHLLGA